MWQYNYTDNYLAHAGKKGMKWGYNDGKKNGKRTAGKDIPISDKIDKWYDDTIGAAGNRAWNKEVATARHDPNSSGFKYDRDDESYTYRKDGVTHIKERSKEGTTSRVVEDAYAYVKEQGPKIAKKVNKWTKTTVANAKKTVSKGVNWVKNLIKKKTKASNKNVKSSTSANKRNLSSSNPRSRYYS